MTAPDGATRRTIEFETEDGAELIGDLTVPPSPTAAAIVCHPHPQYGGTRHDAVVGAVARALVDASIATLCFDFRHRFDEGVGERLDALAALDAAAEEVPGVPLVAAGYSFGAMIVAMLDDPRPIANVLVAPPLGTMGVPEPPEVPTLVLVPAHDPFAPPAVAEPIVARWGAAGADVELRVVEATDHFLQGRLAVVGEHAASWLAGLLHPHRD